MCCFNTQPPEGGWSFFNVSIVFLYCFNTQPPEGGWCFYRHAGLHTMVSTHSRPKAAGTICNQFPTIFIRFQHTAARRRLDLNRNAHYAVTVFQHTAARRRLDFFSIKQRVLHGFNTQPPEGGWEDAKNTKAEARVSTHSRPKAAGF